MGDLKIVLLKSKICAVEFVFLRYFFNGFKRKCGVGHFYSDSPIRVHHRPSVPGPGDRRQAGFSSKESSRETQPENIPSFMGKLEGLRCPIKKWTMKMYVTARMASALWRSAATFKPQPGIMRLDAMGYISIRPVTASNGNPQKTAQ